MKLSFSSVTPKEDVIKPLQDRIEQGEMITDYELELEFNEDLRTDSILEAIKHILPTIATLPLTKIVIIGRIPGNLDLLLEDLPNITVLHFEQVTIDADRLAIPDQITTLAFNECTLNPEAQIAVLNDGDLVAKLDIQPIGNDADLLFATIFDQTKNNNFTRRILPPINTIDADEKERALCQKLFYEPDNIGLDDVLPFFQEGINEEYSMKNVIYPNAEYLLPYLPEISQKTILKQMPIATILKLNHGNEDLNLVFKKFRQALFSYNNQHFETMGLSNWIKKQELDDTTKTLYERLIKHMHTGCYPRQNNNQVVLSHNAVLEMLSEGTKNTSAVADCVKTKEPIQAWEILMKFECVTTLLGEKYPEQSVISEEYLLFSETGTYTPDETFEDKNTPSCINRVKYSETEDSYINISQTRKDFEALIQTTLDKLLIVSPEDRAETIESRLMNSEDHSYVKEGLIISNTTLIAAPFDKSALSFQSYYSQAQTIFTDIKNNPDRNKDEIKACVKNQLHTEIVRLLDLYMTERSNNRWLQDKLSIFSSQRSTRANTTDAIKTDLQATDFEPEKYIEFLDNTYLQDSRFNSGRTSNKNYIDLDTRLTQVKSLLRLQANLDNIIDTEPSIPEANALQYN